MKDSWKQRRCVIVEKNDRDELDGKTEKRHREIRKGRNIIASKENATFWGYLLRHNGFITDVMEDKIGGKTTEKKIAQTIIYFSDIQYVIRLHSLSTPEESSA